MRVIGKAGSGSTAMMVGALAGVESDWVLCWGARASGSGKYINNVARLGATEQLRRMKDAGVNCVEFTTDLATAVRWVRSGEKVFGREIYHTQGRDIVGGGDRRWSSKEYWTKVVQGVEQEWRIHVFKGKVIARGLKVQVGPERRAQVGLGIKNRRNGWNMVHTVEPTDLIRATAKAAVAACGYEIGAVDLLVAGGKVVVLEVNQRPGLDDYTCGQYTKAIRGFVERVR